MEGRPRRRLVVTVRAAADVTPAPKQYVSLTLGDETVHTEVSRTGGQNPVWDEPIEMRLPPPLPHEQPLLVRVRLMSRVPLLPDRMLGSGTQPLSDLFYGGGQHEVTVPLSVEGKSKGHLHLGFMLAKESQPGQDIGSAAGTVLGEIPGGPGPVSDLASAVPGLTKPSAATAEMKTRELFGVGQFMDPSKPGYGLFT